MYPGKGTVVLIRPAQTFYERIILEPEPRQDEKVAKLVESIGGRPWCTSVSNERGEIRVGASDPSTAGLELLAMAVESRTALARFRRDRPDLEDIFLHIVDEEEPATTETGL